MVTENLWTAEELLWGIYTQTGQARRQAINNQCGLVAWVSGFFLLVVGKRKSRKVLNVEGQREYDN